jgi:hypothetical protein
MSSPKTTPAKTARRARTPRPQLAPPEQPPSDAALTDAARRLAGDIERGLAEGRTLSPEALQALMAALCRAYTAEIEAGADILPLRERGNVSNTDVMIMASALLRSANLAVFELGMWQSWTGR